MSLFSLTTNTNLNQKQVASLIQDYGRTVNSDAWGFASGCATFFDSVTDGAVNANVTYRDGLVQATGTATWSAAGSNGDTVTVGNVTFTAVASGPTNIQYTTGASATATAANFAAAVNANPTLTNVVTASAAAGVVTLTSTIGGKVGNMFILSKSSASITVVAFASGAETNVNVISIGL